MVTLESKEFVEAEEKIMKTFKDQINKKIDFKITNESITNQNAKET